MVLGLVLLLFQSVTFGQNELVLSKGLRTIVITEGEYVVPIKYSEPNQFACWKNICKPCPSSTFDSLWVLDSIAVNGMLRFKRVISYRYDTLTDEKYDKFTALEKKEYGSQWIYDTTIVFKDKSYITIFKQPLEEQIKSVRLTELDALQFSIVLDCSKGFKNSAPIWAGLGAFFIATGVGAPGLEENARIRNVGIGIGVLYLSWRIYNSHKVKIYKMNEWTPKIRKSKKRNKRK